MLYRRAYIADCARQMGAVFPVVLSVGSLIFMSRLLVDAVSDALPVSSVWQFLALSLIKYMPQLLIVSLFTGVMLALERTYHSREMTAWFAAGIGLRHFAAPGVMFAIPVVAIIAALSCVLSPWSVRASDLIRTRLVQEINPEDFRPGEFAVAPGGAYTYFFSGDNERPDNVFIARGGGESYEIITARSASRRGRELITLEKGALYRMPRVESADASSPEVIEFESMQINFHPEEIVNDQPRGAKWSELNWDSPADRTEIVWRINQPLAALFFALLAPLLGVAFARGGQRQGFVAAIVLFVIHLNLMYFTRDRMAEGMHVALAILLPPAIVLLLALFIARKPGR